MSLGFVSLVAMAVLEDTEVLPRVTESGRWFGTVISPDVHTDIFVLYQGLQLGIYANATL